jgi:hypothetical protein
LFFLRLRYLYFSFDKNIYADHFPVMKIRKSFFLLFSIAAIIIFLSECIHSGKINDDPRGNLYAGSQSCRQCHQAIFDSFISSSHYNTTRASLAKNVLGSFDHGRNTFIYNPDTRIVMERRDSGLYQVLYVNGKEKEIHRFDVTFGLKHAQTFLTWEGARTFELPVSYYVSVDAWGSSPGGGYTSNEAYFKRAIGINCYECHSSFIAEQIAMTPDKGIQKTLDRNTLVMGIDCERCHGPALNHVNYHMAYPEAKEAEYVITSQSLSRQQKSDACAVCHAGNDRQKDISPFRFKMGDTLANYFAPFGQRVKPESGYDVHGNQYGLLSESKCFLKSQTLTCVTCHDPHADAGNDLTVYSKKCQSCHNNPDHSSLAAGATTASFYKSNCIDCHMPEQPSRVISFQIAGSNATSSYLLRTHRIAIYSDKKGKILEN